MSAALTRYRVLAWATGVFLILLTINMVLKYLVRTEQHLGDWLAMVHGWLYLAYVLTAVDLWFRTGKRLAVGRTVLVVLAGTVPLMSFVAERWVRSQVGPMIEAESVIGAPR